MAWELCGDRVLSVEREFFIDNLLVRIHYIIVMIRWTSLAPWEFAGSLTSTKRRFIFDPGMDGEEIKDQDDYFDHAQNVHPTP